MASLKEAASIGRCGIEDLVPPIELEQYSKLPSTSVRVDSKRSAAAKRAWETIRAKRQAAELRIATIAGAPQSDRNSPDMIDLGA
jgi:hypothetical protein